MNLLTRILLCCSPLLALAPVSLADKKPVGTSDRTVTIPRMDQPPTIEDVLPMERKKSEGYLLPPRCR